MLWAVASQPVLAPRHTSASNARPWCGPLISPARPVAISPAAGTEITRSLSRGKTLARDTHFWSSIWPEAVRDFSRGGIELQTSDGPGEVRRSAGDNPILIGLRRGVINLVLTDHLPMYWDN